LGVIGMVQPNVGFREKWDPAREDSIMRGLLAASQRLESHSGLDLLVWPEAAVPGFFVDHPQWDAAVAALAKERHVPILAGGLDAEFDGPRLSDYFNAAFFYDSTGSRAPYPVYHKHYLVPIVERVPFIPPRWVHLRWFGGFGKGHGFPVYAAAGGRFGVMICYESAFEDLARDYRRHGADFLVNITNDAWFGRTSAPAQHASHLVLRAIETRSGVARAGNSGITEFVDPLGHAYSATELNVEAAVAGHLRTSDVTTVYVRWGDWVGACSVLGTLCLAGMLALRRQSTRT